MINWTVKQLVDIRIRKDKIQTKLLNAQKTLKDMKKLWVKLTIHQIASQRDVVSYVLFVFYYFQWANDKILTGIEVFNDDKMALSKPNT